MSSQISYEEAKNFSGYLEKKSKTVFWQKRFFQIVDGKILKYRIK